MTIKAKELVKIYNDRTVVNNISFEINPAEVVGLLGPNGAGKTTTFYMLVGLIKPDKGKVFIDEKDLTNKPVYIRARAGMGYLGCSTISELHGDLTFKRISIAGLREGHVHDVSMTKEPPNYRLGGE